MSNSILQLTELYQKMKDMDLDKLSSLSSKVDLKDLFDRISRMDSVQLENVMEYIKAIPLKD